MAQPTIIVWGEVPVTDMDRAVKFYNEVFSWNMTIDDSGPNPMANFGETTNGVGGHIYPGTPAKEGEGPTLHIAVPGKLEDAVDRCWTAGGRVLGEPIQIPPGRFAYAQDPDGNSVGLFEPAT